MTWSLFFCGFSTNPGLLMDKRYCELCFSMKTAVSVEKRGELNCSSELLHGILHRNCINDIILRISNHF